MGILFVIPFLTLSVWALIELVLHLRCRQTSLGLWAVFGLLLAGGVAGGIWCGFYLEYHLGSHYRIGSFPIPVVFLHLEDGQWVDFPVPTFQAVLSAITDALCVTALATAPVWLVSFRHDRHGRVV